MYSSYITRLENRTPAALGERVGAHKAVLAKLRKREPLSQDEWDYAKELISDARVHRSRTPSLRPCS